MPAKEELAIILRAKDYATSVFKKFTKAVDSTVRKVFSLRGAFATAAAGFGAMKLVDRAASIEAMGTSFDRLSKKIGGSTKVLEALRKGTRNTVSDFKLMESANRAMLFGVGQSAEQFELLAMLARRLGRAVGRDTVDALNDMFIGIGRQSRLFLDNIGLIVRVQDANRQYAAQLGKTVEELTDVEKRQAFWNAVVKASSEMVQRLGEDTYFLADTWEQFKTVIANSANELIKTLIPALKEFFENSKRWVAENKPKIFSFFAWTIEVLGEIPSLLAEIAAAAQKTFGVLGNILKRAEILRFTGKSIWEFMKSQVPVLGGQQQFEMAIASLKKAADLSDELFENLDADTAKLRAVGQSVLLHTRKIAESIRQMARASADQLAIEKTKSLWQGPMRPPLGRYEEVPLREYRDLGVILESNILTRETMLEGLRAEHDIRVKLGKETAREGAQLERLSTEWEVHENALKGADRAFMEMKQHSQAWGDATYDAIMSASDAVSTTFVDAIFDAEKTFRTAIRSMVRELAKLAMQMAFVKAIQSGLGGLGGLFGSPNNAGAYVPFKTPSAADRALVTSIQPMQAGGYKGRSGFALVGERGPEVVSLPAGSYVHPHSRIGGTVNVEIHNHNPQFRTREQEMAFTREQKEQIRAVVIEANNSSLTFKQAMR